MKALVKAQSFEHSEEEEEITRKRYLALQTRVVNRLK